MDIQSFASQCLTIQLIVLVISLFMLLFMQVVLLQRMYFRLSIEAARTGDFLRLIPVQIIENTPKLRAWFAEVSTKSAFASADAERMGLS
jgi:hypothetical protein